MMLIWIRLRKDILGQPQEDQQRGRLTMSMRCEKMPLPPSDRSGQTDKTSFKEGVLGKDTFLAAQNIPFLFSLIIPYLQWVQYGLNLKRV